MENAFDVLTQKERDERTSHFQRIIDEARDLIGDTDFIFSCQDALDQKGFLTIGQVDALQDISRVRDHGLAW